MRVEDIRTPFHLLPIEERREIIAKTRSLRESGGTRRITEAYKKMKAKYTLDEIANMLKGD